MLILALLAAHEGEEFVIILPAIMLVGAFFILRWANKNDQERSEDEEVSAEERPVGLALPTRWAAARAGGKVAIEPPDETQSAD